MHEEHALRPRMAGEHDSYLRPIHAAEPHTTIAVRVHVTNKELMS
jgi:hypothetical protein